jgi:hypothetical protein
LLDVTSGAFCTVLIPTYLIQLRTADLAQRYQGDGKVTVSANPTTGGTRITGTGRWIPSFGQKTYQAYFCFDAPRAFVQAKYYQGAGRALTFTDLNRTSDGFDREIGRRGPAGVVMGFSPEMEAPTLSVRMGVSWTGSAQACAYAEEEIPDILAFDAVHTAAR